MKAPTKEQLMGSLSCASTLPSGIVFLTSWLPMSLTVCRISLDIRRINLDKRRLISAPVPGFLVASCSVRGAF